MEDYSQQRTTAQLEAHRILTYMLNRLKDPESKYYPRYGKWIERHPRLSEFCLHSIRPQVWTFLSTGKWTLDALKSIGGNLKFDGRAIYFNGVLGTDKRTRLYIGQSQQLRIRLGQHLNFRYRRDNPSLHYYALQMSSWNVFGLLAALPSPSMGNQALPGMDFPELLLNVLEMWMCLVFRTLPAQTLDEWLAEEVERKRDGGFGGLNIASPVDHGGTERVWLDLSACEDGLVREYLSADRKRSEVIRHTGRGDNVVERRHAGEEERVVRVTPGTVLVIGLAVIFVVWMGSRSTDRSR